MSLLGNVGEVLKDGAHVLPEYKHRTLNVLMCVFRELRSSAPPCLMPVPAPRRAKDLQDLPDPLYVPTRSIILSFIL